MKNNINQEVLTGAASIHFYEWMREQGTQIQVTYVEGSKKGLSISWILHYSLVKQWLFTKNMIAYVVPLFAGENKLKFIPNAIVFDDRLKSRQLSESYKDINIAEKHSIKECVRIYNLKHTQK
jgi:predicted phosphatase